VAQDEQALLVGSGSQANLLAIAGTTSHLHERPLKPGDEVITPALGFSTTVGPLYQYGLVPV
jgi:CDP-6-deoxy-D-xylo-4-hexulose-3-dehydrase